VLCAPPRQVALVPLELPRNAFRLCRGSPAAPHSRGLLRPVRLPEPQHLPSTTTVVPPPSLMIEVLRLPDAERCRTRSNIPRLGGNPVRRHIPRRRRRLSVRPTGGALDRLLAARIGAHLARSARASLREPVDRRADSPSCVIHGVREPSGTRAPVSCLEQSGGVDTVRCVVEAERPEAHNSRA
jgi:hypothetical protein